jgi:hypothetical protein
VSDDLSAKSPADTASPDETTEQASSTPVRDSARRARRDATAKKVSKAKARKPTKVAKTPARAPRAASRRSASTDASVRVQIGDDTVFIPKALAADLTPKDLKKLRAVFKRIRKRGKKRAAKKDAGKKKK